MAKAKSKRPPFELGAHKIAAGSSQTVDLPLGVMSNHTPVNLPVHVIHGREPGPTLFVSGAIHGDEIIGVEIIRRLIRSPGMKRLKGTFLAIPIVNALGFLSQSRYLPDRRDLNRCFPGSDKGSLAARLARLFKSEILGRSQFGIDLHSAAQHRTNLPQIRVSDTAEETRALAEAFGAPVILHSAIRVGSLREAAKSLDVKVMVYEAGEALRFDEFAVRAGVKGVRGVMRHLGMLDGRARSEPRIRSVWSRNSSWLRAPEGGLFRAFRTIGEGVAKGDIVGAISDPFGETEHPIVAHEAGLIIGRTNLPVVNQGDALLHIAHLAQAVSVQARVEKMEEVLAADPLFDEDEIL